jgi:hypothetical protein
VLLRWEVCSTLHMCQSRDGEQSRWTPLLMPYVCLHPIWLTLHTQRPQLMCNRRSSCRRMHLRPCCDWELNPKRLALLLRCSSCGYVLYYSLTLSFVDKALTARIMSTLTDIGRCMHLREGLWRRTPPHRDRLHHQSIISASLPRNIDRMHKLWINHGRRYQRR